MYLNDRKITDVKDFIISDFTERVYKDCKFLNFKVDGGEVGAIFIDCNFENIETYFMVFNVSTFPNVNFENCEFEGTSFIGCKFVHCKFINCTFKADQLGGYTRFEGSDLVLSKFENCITSSVEYIDTKILEK